MDQQIISYHHNNTHQKNVCDIFHTLHFLACRMRDFSYRVERERELRALKSWAQRARRDEAESIPEAESPQAWCIYTTVHISIQRLLKARRNLKRKLRVFYVKQQIFIWSFAKSHTHFKCHVQRSRSIHTPHIHKFSNNYSLNIKII